MKKKTLLTSLLTIVMCLALIAGSTYALFTSEDEINIAVTSGKIEVIATINNNSIATTSLGVAQTPGEFANGGTATLEGDKLTLAKLTPGDSVSFTITVENKSTVAMNYRFVWSVEGDLAQYLKATVDGAALVNNATPYTAWTGENTKTLTVVVTLPDTVGNEARDLDADISFTVEAIQGNVTVVDGIVYSADENGNMVINSTLGTLPEKVTILQGTVALPSEQLSGHTTVKEVVIPAGLIDFGGTANAAGTGASGGFFKKSSVEKVTLPEGLTEIPAAAFNQAANLKEVNIPSTVKTVGINAFAYTGLETLTIPATVENIGYGAFRGMANLTTVVIEGNATIANYAFRSCKNLESVYILGDDVTFLTTDGQIFTKNDAGDAKNGVINVYVVNETVKQRLLDATSYDAALNIVVSSSVSDAEDLEEAIADGNKTVILEKGTYDFPSNMSTDGLTIIGQEGVVFNDTLSGSLNNTTIKNVHIKAGNAQRWAYSNGTLLFENCTFEATSIYAIHYDGLNNANITYKNCKIIGWVAIGGGAEHVTFDGCEIYGNGSYGVIRLYSPGTIKNCTFDVSAVNTNDAYQDGIHAVDCTINLSNNTNVNGDMTEIYNFSGTGKLVVDGQVYVATSNALTDALAKGEDVTLVGDVSNNAPASNGYGKSGFSQTNGGVFDGNGNTLTVTGANGTWDSAFNTNGGTIKNLTIDSGFRGIFVTSGTNGKVYLENVTIDGPVYTISCDQASNQGLEAKNSTFNGWTSYAATIGEVKFEGCNFGEGAGYAFCRPYAKTTFVNCNFEAGYAMDPRAEVTFENCYLDGVLITEDNVDDLVYQNLSNVTVK